VARGAQITVSATTGWLLGRSGDDAALLRRGALQPITIEQNGNQLAATASGGERTTLSPPLVARPESAGGFVVVNGKRYRGDVQLLALEADVGAVNRLPVEDYLRGVVPLEMGPRASAEHAALEAQAVAARSFALTKIIGDSVRAFDLTATVRDQVYGGVDAESPAADAAVAATAGLALTYQGRVANATYHSTCGGRTAAASEVWRTTGEPYLVSVSDQIPGTDHYYCDISPRFHWERILDRRALEMMIERYLAAYAPVPDGRAGAFRAIAVDGTTPSGRNRAIAIATSTGRWTVRGNDMRFVLRGAGGEILPSTYFSLAVDSTTDGVPRLITLHGRGNGHGVGLCQWGAIGRARAGQNFRSILVTYYPGTTVGPIE